MRSDYLPSETFCCVCGCVIKEHQIKGNIEGVITWRDSDALTRVDPIDVYLCDEHLSQLVTNIKGGLPMARRKTYELTRSRQDEVGKQGST